MNDGDYLDRLEALVREARLAPAHERDALIQERAGDDDEMRREVYAMLQAEERMGEGFLNAPVSSILNQYLGQQVRCVGPWAIEEVLGEGGMGTVFRGRRADGAFESEVAIKFVREAMMTPGLGDRFLRERQILATLDHPNIATLRDGGVTETGQPYLVMDLVRGESLTAYCDARCASVDERLALFDCICDAVQHAHGKLVVHRDIKPSNILVDDAGRPRLVDFGIASMIDGDDGAARTRSTERRFTPQYAAPEQVRGDPVTVATDVYALGMVLYELLAGARPYEVTGGYTSNDVRTICETDPPRPSRRVDGTDAETIARSRKTEPARLRRLLRGDLDQIVMTALHKQPQRRYATVQAMREDLQRFRQGMPIAARPDSWRYHASRFVARHRAAVAAAAALAIVLVAATVVSTTLAVRLNDRTTALADALIDREQALDEANLHRAAAEREFRRAHSSSSTLIKTLSAIAADDESSQARIVEQLHRQVEQLDAMSLPLSTDAEIATRQSIAMLARTTGAFDLALDQNRRLLELTEDRMEETAVRAAAYGQIGWLHLQRDEPEQAIEAFRRSREQSAPELSHLTMADIQLVEALVMTENEVAALAVLQQRTFPPAPAGDYLREQIRDIETRFDVSLLPEPEPAGVAGND